MSEENGREKRKRRNTKHFEFDSLDNEEQRLMQQAMKNSRVEHTRSAVEIEEAPTFYPTIEEFKNPLLYIYSIREQAAKYGICKIVPPSQWNPPTQINWNDTRKLPTKRQEINTLQEGDGFDRGKSYSIAEYREMARKFKQAWLQQHYSEQYGSPSTQNEQTTSSTAHTVSHEDEEDGPLLAIPIAPNMLSSLPTTSDTSNVPLTADQLEATSMYPQLAKDYWDMVTMGTGFVKKKAVVEYGNDIDTTRYLSGFPSNEGNIDNKTPSLSVFEEDIGEVGEDDETLNAEQIVAANAAAIKEADALRRGSQNVPTKSGVELPQGVESADCTDMFTDAYYRRTGWNLRNIASSDGSILTHLHTKINGVNVPWLYVGMLFSTFCWHNEDNYLYSINYHHFGEAKQWYGVPGAQAKKFEEVGKNFLMEKFRDEPDLLHHMTTQISPSLLAVNRISVYKTTQTPKSFIVTFPKAFHAGFSYGFNVGEAVNFATPDWFSLGTEADERYRTFARNSVFSHQRLLFTLYHHFQEEASASRQIENTAVKEEDGNGSNSSTGMSIEARNILINASRLERRKQVWRNAHWDLLREVRNVLNEELKYRPQLIQSGIRDVSSHIHLPMNNFQCIDKSSSDYDDLRSCWICKHICLLTAVACQCDRQKVSCVRHGHNHCRCAPSERYLLYWMDNSDMETMAGEIDAALVNATPTAVVKGRGRWRYKYN